MKFTNEQYAQALYDSISDTKAKDHDILIENFINILRANGDLSRYEQIIDEYEKYERAQKGITEVEVTTALDAKLNKELLDDLNKVVGKDIELKHKVDSNLVGGVVIRAGDTLIDGSVKHKLENLKDTLTQS